MYACGEEQRSKGFASRLHSKFACSSAENVKVASSLSTVPEGPESMVTVGALVSTVTLVTPDSSETLPAASVALAE